MEVKSLALTTVGLSALDKRDVDPCNRAEGPMSSDRPSAEFKVSSKIFFGYISERTRGR